MTKFIAFAAALIIGCATPAIAADVNPCDSVEYLDHSYTGDRDSAEYHEFLAQALEACAISKDAGSADEFALKDRASKEFASSAATVSRSNPKTLSFINFVKAYDLIEQLELSNEQKGYGSADAIKTRKEYLAGEIRRLAPLVIPSL